MTLLSADRQRQVVSAGTGVAVPVFVAARSRGVTSWWVETHNLVGRPGLAARVCGAMAARVSVSYTHLRAHETVLDLVCRLLLEKKKMNPILP